jgi:hypothetical protein
MQRLSWTLSFVLMATMASACPDDPPTDGAGMDSGTEDGSVSASEAGIDAASAFDAGTDAGPAAQACDPFGTTGTPCDTGNKCSLVRINGGDDGFYFGCVPIPTVGLKAETAPCSATQLDATPEEAGDDHVSDNCDVGLVCLPLDSTGWKCHRMCLGDAVSCGSGGICEFVNLGEDNPDIGACSASSGCDVVSQTGCDSGEGCYVRTTTEGELTGDCATVVLPEGETGEPGSPCDFINNCIPGTMCSQPTLDDGGAGASVCQELCGNPVGDGGPLPDSGASDAGTLGLRICPGMQVCDPLATMGETELYPTPAGLCM